jgi:archaellum component FlaC
MAEVTNDLIYEVLKNVQQRLDRMDSRLNDITEELVGVRLHMHAIQGDVNSIFTRLGTLEARVDRIERRLDIVTEPAN